MTDLIPTAGNYNKLGYILLATVSSMALMVSAEAALARDTGDSHPTFWIEAGGAFDELSSDSDLWLAPNTPDAQTNPTPPFGALPKAGYDLNLEFTVAPRDTDWKFSVGLIYGRALRGRKTSHDQTYKTEPDPIVQHKYDYTNYNFINTAQRSNATHLILDFKVGKDVGLGMFSGKTTLKAGIRWAKLNEDESGNMLAATNAAKLNLGTHAIADFLANHSFDGIGPSLSWNAAVPFVGDQSDGLTLDWEIGAAVLFGKQKSRVNLHTSVYTYDLYGQHGITHSTLSPARSKTVLVPNLGGFAGISWRMPNAKVSVGYKADFFFNAIDAGINSRDTATRGFYGPFATVSFGLGG